MTHFPPGARCIYPGLQGPLDAVVWANVVEADTKNAKRIVVSDSHKYGLNSATLPEFNEAPPPPKGTLQARIAAVMLISFP